MSSDDDESQISNVDESYGRSKRKSKRKSKKKSRTKTKSRAKISAKKKSSKRNKNKGVSAKTTKKRILLNPRQASNLLSTGGGGGGGGSFNSYRPANPAIVSQPIPIPQMTTQPTISQPMRIIESVPRAEHYPTTPAPMKTTPNIAEPLQPPLIVSKSKRRIRTSTSTSTRPAYEDSDPTPTPKVQRKRLTYSAADHRPHVVVKRGDHRKRREMVSDDSDSLAGNPATTNDWSGGNELEPEDDNQGEQASFSTVVTPGTQEALLLRQLEEQLATPANRAMPATPTSVYDPNMRAEAGVYGKDDDDATQSNVEMKDTGNAEKHEDLITSQGLFPPQKMKFDGVSNPLIAFHSRIPLRMFSLFD